MGTMKHTPKTWKWWGNSYLAEWGEYEPTGRYTAQRVIWSEPGDHYDDNRRVIVEASWRKGGTHSSACLKYMGQSRRLWVVRAKSVAEAIRRHETRVRRFVRGLIRAAHRMAYRRSQWGCLYARDGQPLASIYRWDWDLRHAFRLFGSEFVQVFRDFNGRLEIWRYAGNEGAWSGQGLPPSPEHAYWIAA